MGTFVMFALSSLQISAPTAIVRGVFSNPWSYTRVPLPEAPYIPTPPAVLCLRFFMREECSSLFPVCTHEVVLSTQARNILTAR